MPTTTLPVRSKSSFRSGPAGPTDVYTRAIGEELRKSLHQPFVMDNRPGAGTTIGTDFVAKSPPDGYTLLMVSGTQTVNETLYAHKQYQLMRDLVPVAPLIDTDLVLVVHPSVQAKTLGELLALARSNPGTINYGSSGPGSNYHMAGELLKNLAGVDIVHVPYKGSTGARNDILSGQIQMLFEFGADHGADDQGGAGARLSERPARPARHPARCSDDRRSGRCGFQRDPLGRVHGAGGYAATDHRQTQSGDHQDHVSARISRRPGKRQARRRSQ